MSKHELRGALEGLLDDLEYLGLGDEDAVNNWRNERDVLLDEIKRLEPVNTYRIPYVLRSKVIEAQLCSLTLQNDNQYSWYSQTTICDRIDECLRGAFEHASAKGKFSIQWYVFDDFLLVVLYGDVSKHAWNRMLGNIKFG